jgi:hypothetical protein
VRPEQHGDELEHDWPELRQLVAVKQYPPEQVRPVQQGEVLEQVCPDARQVVGAAQ